MNTSMNNLRNETIQGPFELVNGRLGYAGRGIVPGSTYLELMGVDQERKTSFVLISLLECEYEKVMISKYPMFDIAVNCTENELNFESEWKNFKIYLNMNLILFMNMMMKPMNQFSIVLKC